MTSQSASVLTFLDQIPNLQYLIKEMINSQVTAKLDQHFRSIEKNELTKKLQKKNKKHQKISQKIEVIQKRLSELDSDLASEFSQKLDLNQAEPQNSNIVPNQDSVKVEAKPASFQEISDPDQQKPSGILPDKDREIFAVPSNQNLVKINPSSYPTKRTSIIGQSPNDDKKEAGLPAQNLIKDEDKTFMARTGIPPPENSPAPFIISSNIIGKEVQIAPPPYYNLNNQNVPGKPGVFTNYNPNPNISILAKPPGSDTIIPVSNTSNEPPKAALNKLQSSPQVIQQMDFVDKPQVPEDLTILQNQGKNSAFSGNPPLLFFKPFEKIQILPGNTPAINNQLSGNPTPAQGVPKNNTQVSGNSNITPKNALFSPANKPSTIYSPNFAGPLPLTRNNLPNPQVSANVSNPALGPPNLLKPQKDKLPEPEVLKKKTDPESSIPQSTLKNGLPSAIPKNIPSNFPSHPVIQASPKPVIPLQQPNFSQDGKPVSANLPANKPQILPQPILDLNKPKPSTPYNIQGNFKPNLDSKEIPAINSAPFQPIPSSGLLNLNIRPNESENIPGNK